MKLIIDIADDQYKAVQDGMWCGSLYEELKNGIPVEPCGDCISRDAALDLIADYDLSMGQVVKGIHALPPVTPQPKMGRWIDIMVEDIPAQACDQCNTFYPLAYTGGGHKYCPNCGAKMSEIPTGSEGSEE